MARSVDKTIKAIDGSEDLLAKLVGWVDSFEDATAEARKLAEKCRDYYDNEQWTSEEKAALRKRNQPDTVINRIKSKVDFLLGTEITTRSDPKAYPRNPGQDEEAAQAATDALRYIGDINRFNSKKTAVFENMIIEGYGGVKTETPPDKSGKNHRITIKRIPWDRIVYDPASREHDFTDALYRGEYIWMDLDDAVAMFPDKKLELTNAAERAGGDDDTSGDKPKQWADRKRKRLKVCELWYRDGSKFAGNFKIMRCIFTKGALLAEPEDSPYSYTDENGEEWQEDPYDFMSNNIDRDNARYGTVPQYLGPQDEINKRRSKALHMMSVRPIRIDPKLRGQFQTEDSIRQEAARADGVFFGAAGEVEFLTNGDLAAAHFQLQQEAKNEIDAVGVNAALSGKDERALSGRAIQARQQGGAIELGRLIDNLRQWQHAVYRKCWNRVKQFWNDEKWVRVTDDENNIKFVALNKPLSVGEVFQKETGEMPPENDPMATMPSGQVQNAVADLDVDIIIDESPDTVSIQQEQFEQLTSVIPMLVQAQPQMAPVLAESLFEASGLRNKNRILEKLKGGGEDPAQAQMQAQMQQMQAQMQQMMAELGMKKQQADIAKTEAETMKIKAQAVHEMAGAEAKNTESEMRVNTPPEYAIAAEPQF